MASTLVKEETVFEGLLACRICLASDVKLFNIREWGLDQVFVDVMDTTLSACDRLPQYLCTFCRALLQKGHDLRLRCWRAEELLKDALRHEHEITTSYIRSIDRKLHNLAHTYSHYYSNNIKLLGHEGTQKVSETYTFLIDNIDNDIKDFDTNVTYDDDDNDTNLDDKPNITQIELEVEVSQNTPKVNIIESTNQTVTQDENIPQVNTIKLESDNKTIGKDKKSRKRKLPGKNVKKSAKIAEKDGECKKPVRKKKQGRGKAWRSKLFCKENGFKEFEEKYNFKIVLATEEDMMKELEARKDSDNYKWSDFKCDSCYKGFLSQNTYDNHMKLHDPTFANVCRICKKRFCKPSGMRRHIRDDHQLKFVCLRCDETIRSKFLAIKHAEFHEGKTFKCDYCDQEFVKLTTINTHIRLCHPHEKAEGGTCTLCGETFLSATGLRMHQARSHGTNLPILRCRTCKLRFETYAAIDRHRREQPGGKCDNKHSSCMQCGEVCANEQEVLTHRKEQHALQLFTCDMCTKTFESKESVATHIDRVHRLIKPGARRGATWRKCQVKNRKPHVNKFDTVCELCGKRSSCLATLKIHMNKHTGERPYKCSLCPKTYATPQGLKNHEPAHTGARRWRCKECDATFKHQSSLGVHRNTVHSAKKAYMCDICSKTFTQSGSLYTHVKYVHLKVKPPPRKRNKKSAT